MWYWSVGRHDAKIATTIKLSGPAFQFIHEIIPYFQAVLSLFIPRESLHLPFRKNHGFAEWSTIPFTEAVTHNFYVRCWNPVLTFPFPRISLTISCRNALQLVGLAVSASDHCDSRVPEWIFRLCIDLGFWSYDSSVKSFYSNIETTTIWCYSTFD